MPKLDRVSGLEDHLGYWLRYVSNQVSAAFARRLEGFDVSVAEWVVLRNLYDRPLAPSDLAQRMGMTRGGISKLGDRLAGKQLVAREAAAGDRRFQCLVLSEAGRQLVPELARLADRNDAEFFGELSAAERQTIRAAMEVIVRGRKLIAVPVP